MEIIWKLEEGGTIDGRIDPDDLLGEVTLSSKGSAIYNNCTYLDYWFNALVSGYEAVVKGEELHYDLICEPDPLCFFPKEHGMQISYIKSSIEIEELDEFRIELLTSAKNLLQAIRHESPDKSIKPLQQTLEFVMKWRNGDDTIK